MKVRKHLEKLLRVRSFTYLRRNRVNPFHPSVAFHIEIGLKWVKEEIMISF